MPITKTTSGSHLSGSVLSAPQKGVYSTVPKFDERLLLSSEQTAKAMSSTGMAFTMFDGIIGVSLVVIIGFIIYLVATSGKKGA